VNPKGPTCAGECGAQAGGLGSNWREIAKTAGAPAAGCLSLVDNRVGGEAGLPNQLVQALLQYRLQVPMVEKMLAELNLNLDKGQILPTDLGETVSEKPKA
jgi:hypothetical protein